MAKNIILVGFMGTGKSVVGYQVAQLIGYNFIDTDRIIEEQEGMPIREIFERYGEPHFRRIEKEVIKGLSDTQSSVIATGGGAIVDPENLESLKKNGIMICLKASPEIIMKRTEGNSDRPLLKDKDRLMEIKGLLETREEYYAKADISIDTTDMNIPEIVRKIADYVEKRSIRKKG